MFLTRFSVRFAEGQTPPDDEWLLYRLAFFEQATVASMRAQTLQADDWLVFCDRNAPAWLVEELEALADGAFTPVWLDEPWSHAALRKAVSEVADRRYLITTRLDSDDALGRRFVELVQREFRRQDAEYVNLLRGYQVERSGQVFHYDYAQNPFISLIERVEGRGEPRTVFQSFGHRQSRSLAPVRNVVTRPAWMQVIHGANLANEVRGPRASPRAVMRDVDMALDYDRSVRPLTLVRQWARSWARLMRLWMRRPHLAREYLEAWNLGVRGTTTLPQRRP